VGFTVGEAVRRERALKTLAAPYAGITRFRFQGFPPEVGRSQEPSSTPAA